MRVGNAVKTTCKKDRSKKNLSEVKAGLIDSPAISDIQGNMLTAKDIDHILVSCLSRIYENDNSLVPIDIRNFIEKDEEDMRIVFERYYSCYRTFRRFSDSRALENKH